MIVLPSDQEMGLPPSADPLRFRARPPGQAQVAPKSNRKSDRKTNAEKTPQRCLLGSMLGELCLNFGGFVG